MYTPSTDVQFNLNNILFKKSILKEIGKHAQLSLALFLLQVNWYEWKI